MVWFDSLNGFVFSFPLMDRLKKAKKKLHRYISTGRIKAINKLFRDYYDVADSLRLEINSPYRKNKWYFHKYCAKGESSMVHVLYNLDADLSILDKHGSNSLHIALNYTLDNFDCAFFNDAVVELYSNASEELRSQKNKYGETANDLFAEVVDLFISKQSENLNENDDKGIEDCDWNEKIFFEMSEDNFGNDAYADLEHADTYQKEKEESFSDWGDRIRKEFYEKNCRKNVRSESLPQTKKRKIESSNITEVLKKKLKILKLREAYEEDCRCVFGQQEDTKLCFERIPWPVSKSKLLFSNFNSHVDEMIEVLTYGFTNEDKIKYIKKQQIRWHPDRFLQKCGHRLHEKDKESVFTCVQFLSQKINALANDLK